MATLMVLSFGLLLMTGTLSAQKGKPTVIDLTAVTQIGQGAALHRSGLSSFPRSTTRPSGTTRPASSGNRTPDEMVRPWGQAISVCAERPVGGRFGWRLPSIHELMTLLDPTTGNPALPVGHPFSNVQPSLYWSATTSAEDSTLAYYVGFFTPT